MRINFGADHAAYRDRAIEPAQDLPQLWQLELIGEDAEQVQLGDNVDASIELTGGLVPLVRDAATRSRLWCSVPAIQRLSSDATRCTRSGGE